MNQADLQKALTMLLHVNGGRITLSGDYVREAKHELRGCYVEAARDCRTGAIELILRRPNVDDLGEVKLAEVPALEHEGVGGA